MESSSCVARGHRRSGARSSRSPDLAQRSRTVLAAALALLDQQVALERFTAGVFGPRGIVARTFRTPEEHAWFRGTAEYRRIQSILAYLVPLESPTGA